MNPWLVRLRQRREMEQIGETGLPLVPVDVSVVHVGRTFPGAITDGWLARHHPALWKKVQALDAVLSHLEERGLEDKAYEQRLHDLTTLCQQVEDLRGGEWSALFVKSAVLGGEEMWVVKKPEDVVEVQGDGHVVYLVEEIVALQGKTPEDIREIHRAKRAQPGGLIQEKPPRPETLLFPIEEAQTTEQCPKEQGHNIETPVFAVSSFDVVTTAEHLDRLLPRILSAPVIGVDSETTGLDPLTDRLRLLQFAVPGLTAVIDLQMCPVQALRQVFTTPRTLVFHNAAFDLRFLITAGLPWPHQVCDTMLLNQLLSAGTEDGRLDKSGLASVVHRHLRCSLPKDEQRSNWAGTLSAEQLAYAARDAAVLLPLAEKLTAMIQTEGLTRAAEIENRCVPAVAWLELTGLPVDAERWLQRANQEEERVRALEGQLNSVVGLQAQGLFHETFGVNWQSPTQVLEVLRDRGHDLTATSAAALRGLDDPLASTLLDYRDAAVRAQTFGKDWLDKHRHPITGRIHANYFQYGAASGRMSCTKPNVQNIPRSGDYRASVRPDEGRCLIKADFSQIELRIAAVLANDKAMLSAFRDGQDLHAVTAARVLGIPQEQVEKGHRQLAKALNFGLLYGMGVRGLRDYAGANYKVALTEGQARQHRSAFFRTYPGLATWHHRVGTQLDRKKRVDTRTFTGRRQAGVTAYTVALNTPVQGTGADGLKLALARLFEHRVDVPEAALIACVHDEVVMECPLALADQTTAWLKRHMIGAMEEVIGEAVSIEVETTVGRDWAGTPLKAPGEEDSRGKQ